MQSVARKVVVEPVSQEIGRVVSIDGGLRVRTGEGEVDARRAVSCLVEPAVDDIVLVALAPNGAAYVLAVLERDEGAKATLRVDGDLELRVPAGRFTVAAQEGIDLVSGKAVAVTARGVDVHASTANVVLEKLAYLGTAVAAEVSRIKVLAGTFDAVMDRLSQKVKRSYRTVEETDQLRAERIDYTASSTMSLHSENALVTAEQLVKVDGEQIHLG